MLFLATAPLTGMDDYPEPHEDTDEPPVLQLIPDSFPPQFLHQCASWKSSCGARENDVFVRNGSRSHDCWTETEENGDRAEEGTRTVLYQHSVDWLIY